ncbi:MAG: NAD(P)H-hydrate dehydratase [Verrucomicrobiales bacterium]|nr:NAD(P)H-hydrate dehydratase [Verrucomicrobiales bacterium]
MPEPILSIAEIRDREERTWAAGVTQESVIRRAGAAVAAVAMRLTRPDAPVLVLAGKGHNGSDAVVAEEHLADRDTVLLRMHEHDPRVLDSAHQWLEQFKGRQDALIIDGLFGIGLSRPVEDDWRRLVETVNASGLRVLSVDVPSGLNADTGEPMGVAIEAAVTLTLGSVKKGLLTEPATRYVGRLELAHDIGLVPGPELAELLWTLDGDFSGYPPRRPEASHKGTFGHVAVLAGSMGYHGAAVLTARGALRARPGLVTVYTEERVYPAVAAQLQAAMVRPWRGDRLPENVFSAFVVGPGLAAEGLSPAIRDEVCRLWTSAPQAVVADATALDWLPRAIAAEAGYRVVTPHPGEAARLLGVTVGEVQSDRVAAVRRISALWRGADVFTVLKGRHTVVGGASGIVHINGTGNPGLAQGGTGDVLAGYLGGWLAQPTLHQDVGQAIRFGVWRHGAAADALEARGFAWTAEDLAGALHGL